MAEAREKEYVSGFYAAIAGVKYLAESPGVKVSDIIAQIDEVIDEMKRNGELGSETQAIDELISLAREAERMGKGDEFYDILDKKFGLEGK